MVVAAPTGVVYRTQGGGTRLCAVRAGGLSDPRVRSALDHELKQIFVRELREWGSRGLEWPQELLARLRKAVAVHLYGSARCDDTWPSPLVLDESRLAEADEAWVPVLTPDGPNIQP
ncbi:DUF6210 family protein [Streptomyces sp. NPDC051001]|uniref:DUF6210 family protein n=1 Tax=Streptomyces sp. NPDC051001 TaxID=3155795 RepID=UPI00343D1216